MASPKGNVKKKRKKRAKRREGTLPMEKRATDYNLALKWGKINRKSDKIGRTPPMELMRSSSSGSKN